MSPTTTAFAPSLKGERGTSSYYIKIGPVHFDLSCSNKEKKEDVTENGKKIAEKIISTNDIVFEEYKKMLKVPKKSCQRLF